MGEACVASGFLRVPALLALMPLLAAAQVFFEDTPGRVSISLAGQPFSNLYYGSEWASPFLHPLRSASGVVVTRGYPVELIAGENQDHKWHHGLWFSHGDINGVDFWRDLGPEKTGRMVVKSRPKTSRNALSLEAELVTPGKQVLGTTHQEFRFTRSGSDHLIDARVTVRASRSAPLRMGDTEEGTFGLRLADAFREERGVAMHNSAGDSGRKIWGKRAKWVDYSTTIQGRRLGVLVLDHPANPKHPTYWHARHYSLCAANPFGEHDFEKDKTRDGGVTIPAGGTLAFRYRVIIHEGGLDSIDPEDLFKEFSRSK